MTDSNEILGALSACISRIDALAARLDALDERPHPADEPPVHRQLPLIDPISPGDTLPPWLFEVQPGALYDALYLAIEIGADVLDDELHRRAARVAKEVERAQTLIAMRQRADRAQRANEARAQAYARVAAETAPDKTPPADGELPESVRRDRESLNREIRDRVARLHQKKS